MEKQEALAKFLEVKESEVEVTKYDNTIFEAEGGEYLVLTDDEADRKTGDYIRETIWAFNPEFLACHMPEGVNEEIIRLAQEKCEGANETLKAMIVDFDHLVDDAIGCDGRGHFLSSYDGEENEEGDYFIYRVN